MTFKKGGCFSQLGSSVKCQPRKSSAPVLYFLREHGLASGCEYGCPSTVPRSTGHPKQQKQTHTHTHTKICNLSPSSRSSNRSKPSHTQQYSSSSSALSCPVRGQHILRMGYCRLGQKSHTSSVTVQKKCSTASVCEIQRFKPELT